MYQSGLKGFIQRCRLRSLTIEDGDIFFFWVIVPLLVPSILGGALIDVEDGRWIWQLPLTYLGPFCVAGLAYLAYCGAPQRASFYEIVWQMVWPILLGPILAVSFFGYFYWINVLTGSDEPVQVSGQIVEKKNEFARYTGKTNILYVEYEGRRVGLEVSADDYTRYDIGAKYSQVMFRGGLGYLYVWRFNN